MRDRIVTSVRVLLKKLRGRAAWRRCRSRAFEEQLKAENPKGSFGRRARCASPLAYPSFIASALVMDMR